MKLGLLTTGFPRFDGDHCGAFLLTLAKGITQAGPKLVVLAPEPRERRVPPRWPNIEVRWVPYVRPRRLEETFYGSGAPDNIRLAPWRGLGAMTFAGLLVRRARAELSDCDALLSSWCVPSGWVASRVADGRPHLCICHATDLRWLGRLPAGHRIARQIAAGSSAMWFLSESHRDDFLELARLPSDSMTSHIGAMPCDPAEPPRQSRDDLRRSLGLERTSFLFLGRLVPIKGVDVLLRAAAGLEPKVELRIAGDGPERARLSAMAAELGVDARFEGWVAGDRKKALLRACDALVVPSRPGDGLPTVLAEARAHALPIIATRVGAIPAYIGADPNTRLVCPESPTALRRALGELTG